jgi:predicted Zn-dependent protease
MKRIIALVVVLVVAAGAMYLAQRRERHDAVNANAVVDLAADWQSDLTRVPMRLTRISDDREVRIGNEIARRYISANPALTSKEQFTEHYVKQIGARVAAHAKRQLDFQFHLVPDRDLINAFALPGGHVFIGQGLLDRMESEDELAYVLGHEIEHIDHFHSVERIQIEAQLHKLNLDVVAEITQFPISLWEAGYSKEQEFEADREGLRIAVQAGYSAQGALDLLAKLAQLDRAYVLHADTPTEELSQVAIDGLEGYFRTHPLPAERIQQANEVIAEDLLPVDRPLSPIQIEHELKDEAQQ